MSIEYDINKPTGFDIGRYFGAKKKGLYISFQPNVSAKIATLTEIGEEFFSKNDVRFVVTPKTEEL